MSYGPGTLVRGTRSFQLAQLGTEGECGIVLSGLENRKDEVARILPLRILTRKVRGGRGPGDVTLTPEVYHRSFWSPDATLTFADVPHVTPEQWAELCRRHPVIRAAYRDHYGDQALANSGLRFFP